MVPHDVVSYRYITAVLTALFSVVFFFFFLPGFYKRDDISKLIHSLSLTLTPLSLLCSHSRGPQQRLCSASASATPMVILPTWILAMMCLFFFVGAMENITVNKISSLSRSLSIHLSVFFCYDTLNLCFFRYSLEELSSLFVTFVHSLPTFSPRFQRKTPSKRIHFTVLIIF